jgi:hypothetical protein
VADVSALQSAVGQRVARVRRGRFLYGDDRPTEHGFLELTFRSGDLLLLDIGGDWTLTVRTTTWVDAFAEPLSEGNRDFVARHGKWIAVDVSESEAAPLVGSAIEAVTLLHDETNDVVGATLTSERALVRAFASGGDLSVEITHRG